MQIRANMCITEGGGHFQHLLGCNCNFLTQNCNSISMAVFWVVAPCRLVEVYQCFRGACCLHHQGDRPDDGSNAKKSKMVSLEEQEALSLPTGVFP
jgi:hypothetical protein